MTAPDVLGTTQGDPGRPATQPPTEVPREELEALEPDGAAEVRADREQAAARPGPTGTPPPTTGDHAVDEAIRGLDSTAGHDLDARLDSGERVHRVLRDRLSDLRE